MDYIKSFDIDFLENWKNLKKYLTQENAIVLFLILYISIISIYTPRHIISLINLPIIKILSLLLIIYIFSINPKISILLTIAFLITINLENSIQFIENYPDHAQKSSKITHTNKNKKKNKKTDGDEDDDEESDGEDDDEESDSEDDNEESEEDDEESDGEDDDEESDGEDDDEESDDSDEDADQDEEKKDEFAQYNEGFNINNIKPARNLDDNFTHLHKAMHKLEKFISKK